MKGGADVEGYKAAARDCKTEFTEKKSRFISYLKCVSTEDGARAFIESVRASHRDATHNCFAYRLREPRVERFSDDGEPSGTAGMPMLEVLKKEDVFDVCVVVTRYFGGVLLGGGGLIRAYSRGVSDALAESGTAHRLPSVTLALEFGYDGYSRAEKLLSGFTHNRTECTFAENVRLTLSIISDEQGKLISELSDALCGRLTVTEISRGFDSFNLNL